MLKIITIILCVSSFLGGCSGKNTEDKIEYLTTDQVKQIEILAYNIYPKEYVITNVTSGLQSVYKLPIPVCQTYSVNNFVDCRLVVPDDLVQTYDYRLELIYPKLKCYNGVKKYCIKV